MRKSGRTETRPAALNLWGICDEWDQNTPWAIMASATRWKPAMFAPATRL